MKRLADWWFAPAPAERLAALRIVIGGFALVYVAVRLPEFVGVARYGRAHFAPLGIVRVLDAPLAPNVALAIGIATCILLGAFVAGFRYRITAPLAAVALLWTLTYRNAWGQIFHTENLLALHVIALALAPAADAWAVASPGSAGARSDANASRRMIDRPRASHAGYGWPIKLMAALTAATYVIAGFAKLRIAGAAWLDGELLRNQIAVDNLRKALLGDAVAPLAHPFLDHPGPLVVFSVMTLVIELGAPVALAGRRIGYAWVLLAWGFHVGVVLMMNIFFPYPLLGVAFLPLVPAERIVQTVIRAARGIRGRLGR